MKQTPTMLRRIFKPNVTNFFNKALRRRYSEQTSGQSTANKSVGTVQEMLGQWEPLIKRVYYSKSHCTANSGLATGAIVVVGGAFWTVVTLFAEAKIAKETAKELNNHTKQTLDNAKTGFDTMIDSRFSKFEDRFEFLKSEISKTIKSDITSALSVALNFTEAKVKEHIAMHAKEDERRYGELKSAISKLEGANEARAYVLRKE